MKSIVISGGKRLVGVVILGLFSLNGCGGGIPVQVRTDQMTVPFNLDFAREAAGDLLKSHGILAEKSEMPTQWSENLPNIEILRAVSSPPVGFSFTELLDQTVGGNEKSVEMITDATNIIRRVELNSLKLRIDENSLTMALPPIKLQLADKKDAKSYDKEVWRTIGYIEKVEAGKVGDKEFTFIEGGETFFTAQLMDETKEFSIRLSSELDLTLDPGDRTPLPAGGVAIRLLAVATFYIDAYNAATFASDQAGQP
ncbi:MAG: hypothetical protein VYA34_05720 [Myxococcota bacterium]|nr:hypothetical protein [Myxococcota bacterium]